MGPTLHCMSRTSGIDVAAFFFSNQSYVKLRPARLLGSPTRLDSYGPWPTGKPHSTQGTNCPTQIGLNAAQ